MKKIMKSVMLSVVIILTIFVVTNCEVQAASSIKITKDDNGDHNDTQRVNQGEDAYFSIDVKNNGTEKLTNISVLDQLAPNCAKSNSESKSLIEDKYGKGHDYLEPNESFSYVCTDTDIQADYTNTATTEGSGNLNVVSDSDDSKVILGTSCEPKILIEKNDNDNKDDTQTINQGGTATFTIKVSNRGTEKLTNISVSDPLAPNCSKSASEVNTLIETKYGAGHNYLDQLEFFEYICTDTDIQENYKNTATAKGDGSIKTVEDSDDSNVVVILNPINGECNSEYNGKELDNQPTINLCTKGVASSVTGTGTINDPWKWTCNGQNGGTIASCSAKKKILNNPAIQIIKDDNDNSDDKQTINQGGTASFKISVKNIGNVDLINVVVTDLLAPNCSKTIGNLAVNQTYSYTCAIDNVSQGFTNTANVTATGNNQSVNSSDTSLVIVNNGNTSVDIIKEARNGGDTQTIEKGKDAYFKITVKNTGTARINTISVSDQEASNCNLSSSQAATLISQKYNRNYLESNESFSYECKDENVDKSYINVAVVTATSNNGTSQNSDSSKVNIEGNNDCDGSIGDFVWNDKNKNGIQDSGEEGIGGVRLKLYRGNDLEKEKTDSQGEYEFNNLCKGDYKVVVAVETLPKGCYQTYDKDGKLDNSISTQLENGEDYKKADFGYYCPSNVPVVPKGTTSPATGAGALAGGVATLFASGSALFSLRRTRKL